MAQVGVQHHETMNMEKNVQVLDKTDNVSRNSGTINRVISTVLLKKQNLRA
jgi:hypothetical protein